MIRLKLSYSIILAFSITLISTQTQAQTSDEPQAAQADSPIVATVDGRAISERQLERAYLRSIGKLKLSDSQKKIARAKTLENLINRHVVLGFLESRGIGAGKNQITEKFDDLSAQLETVGKTLQQHLEESNVTKAELEFNFSWQIAWSKYTEQKLSDDVLKKHFEKHRRKFDGTKLRVAHLLLKPTGAVDRHDEIKKLEINAQEILDSIESGSTSWDEAVRKHSQAPTYESGGEIGWISLEGPMPQPFSDAAFQLAASQISPPTSTAVGVHLIKCLEVKKGKIGWRDNRKQVKADAMEALFYAIVMKHLPNTKIEVTAKDGEVPAPTRGSSSR